MSTWIFTCRIGDRQPARRRVRYTPDARETRRFHDGYADNFEDGGGWNAGRGDDGGAGIDPGAGQRCGAEAGGNTKAVAGERVLSRAIGNHAVAELGRREAGRRIL